MRRLYIPVIMICLMCTGCGRNEAYTEQSTSRSDGRTVLTVAAESADGELTKRVNAFNESSENYYVEIEQYARAALEDEADGFLTWLSMDILSGDGSDLVCFDWGSYSPSAAGGKLMEDLNGFLDRDAEVCREDYYENILDAFSVDGALYVLPTSFTVETMCGKAEELGEDRGTFEGWEMDEMIETYEESPHARCLTVNDSNRLCFQEILGGCIENFVDWETGECRFDTEEFAALLEFSRSFGGQLSLANESGFSYRNSLESGEILLEPVLLTSPWDVAVKKIVFGGSRILWPGYPTADGEKELGGGVAAAYGCALAISRSSGEKEGAWEFIKSFLTPEAQRETSGIPILKSVSEERIADAMRVEYEEKDGSLTEKVRHESRYEGEESISLTAVSEEDAEDFRSLIAATHRCRGTSPGLMEIILEEADAFWSLQTDAKVVSSIIQNRAKIYVEERLQ